MKGDVLSYVPWVALSKEKDGARRARPCRCSRHHRQQEIVHALSVMAFTPVLIVQSGDQTTYKVAKEQITAPPSHPLSLVPSTARIRWCQCLLGRPAVSSTRLVARAIPSSHVPGKLENMPPSQATSQSCPQAHTGHKAAEDMQARTQDSGAEI